MTKDLLLAAVFLLNIALMAYITLDVLRRKKDSSAETTGGSADTNLVLLRYGRPELEKVGIRLML